MIVTDLLESLAAVALLLLLAIGALFTRRVVIRRRGGTFDCSLCLTPGSARAAVHYGAGYAAYGISSGASGNHHDPAHSQRQHPRAHEHPQPNGDPVADADADTRASANSATNRAHHYPASMPLPAKRGTRTPWSAAGVRAGRGWAYGIAQYENDRIDWFRIFSYAYRPAAVLTRRDLEIIGRRDAEGHEELALFPGWTIVECRFGTGLVELAMSPDALTGFLSWIEGAPPGQNVSRVS